MTKQTKPSAGAMRAARKIAERTLRTLQGWDEQTWVDIAAHIIDREMSETGVAELSELLEAAKEMLTPEFVRAYRHSRPVQRLTQAIIKAEQ